MHGEDPHISADRVTSLALLFHEYATNAVKYGALSVADGRLDITLTSKPDCFEIAWQESNTRAATIGQIKETGFGTTLEKMMVQSLNAQVSRDWQPHGLLIKLAFPRDAFALPPKPEA